MKLENCGRCGLEPVKMAQVQQYTPNGSVAGMVDTWGCPVHDANEWTGKTEGQWNAAQFAARTERINAAALVLDAALIVAPTAPVRTDSIRAAVSLIDEQDAATRVRWAEMQKGE